MQIPNRTALGTGLRRWREHHGLTVKEIERRCRKISKKPFTANLAYKWETGTLAPSYERLVQDILPAYEINTLPKLVIFLASFCQPKSTLDSVTLIKSNDLSLDNRLGIAILFAEESRINPHLVRIDQVTITSKAQSEVTAHRGYNYLLVTDGSLRCSFWKQGKRVTGRAELEFELEKGDAIVFPTDLPHKIESTTTTEAHVVIARPPWGRPDPLTLSS